MENYGYLRVGTAVPQVNVADVDFNVANIVKLVNQASKQKVQVLVFPELSITGYTCGDLFASECLLEAAEQGIAKLCGEIAQESMLVLVGAPLRRDGQLFNCAVAIQNGNVIAVVPKSFIPNYKEFYEKRWFAGCVRPMPGAMIKVNGVDVPFGTDLLLEAGAMKLGVELCEDLWAPMPPSASLAINGANVIANLSASNELVGKHDYLLGLIKHQSATCIAAYVYSSCGYGESTTDVVFGGNAIIAENGHVLCESERFVTNSRLEIADVDIEAINNDRRVKTSFSDSKERFRLPMRHIALATLPSLDLAPDSLKRYVEKAPFIPTENSALQSRCSDIINIQAMGLMRRMEFTGIKKLVIGISGGIDSTLALMVAVEAFDRLNIDRKDIYGITMPGFGTTDRTHDNAVALMKALGISTKEIPIVEAVKQHFNDIEHDINNHDVTYENCQARERTQILMDFANKVNALVLGTGDLSELALGWATYNGDHMSMYNVNVSIPKTLAKHLLRWFASQQNEDCEKQKLVRTTLLDVLDTPISPELTPANSDGTIAQKTEDLVGPYELHDFFLYHTLRHGYAPSKIYFLARKTFVNDYDSPTIKKWLTKFYWRFFSQQFKRSCLPDGPKVGSASLSPRGDWRMPSDATAAMWIKECESLQ